MDQDTGRPDAAAQQPRTWHWWVRADGESSAQDMRAAIQHSAHSPQATPSEVQMRLAEFRDLVSTAQSGGLREGAWKPVARDPTLWELRWRWHDGTNVRGYFHEPTGRYGTETVLARVHLKRIHRDEGLTRRAQNTEIDAASTRMRTESQNDWGLPGSPTVVN